MYIYNLLLCSAVPHKFHLFSTCHACCRYISELWQQTSFQMAFFFKAAWKLPRSSRQGNWCWELDGFGIISKPNRCSIELVLIAVYTHHLGIIYYDNFLRCLGSNGLRWRGRGLQPIRNLGVQLTLFMNHCFMVHALLQPGVADYAHHITACPLGFENLSSPLFSKVWNMSSSQEDL